MSREERTKLQECMVHVKIILKTLMSENAVDGKNVSLDRGVCLFF